MDLGSQVGSGRTADLFAVDDARVVKLFESGTSAAEARREAHNAEVARDVGLPVPTVHECVTIEGRPGIVMERIDGPSMLSRMDARPWTAVGMARRLAELHASIHASHTAELDSLRDRLAGNVREATLAPDVRDRTLAHLDRLPEGTVICHGDFHPGNVLLAEGGPVVIDWLDARSGHPAADVARTSILLAFAGGRRTLVRRLVRRLYLRRYCAITSVTRAEIERWELPVAAARLAEDVPEAPRLRRFVHSRLGED